MTDVENAEKMEKSSMPSKMVIEKGFFSSREEVMDDISSTGFWPTTFISNKSPELPIHYHDHDIISYVMEGEAYLLDEDGNKVQFGVGDRMVIPKGAWHAEGANAETVVYIVTLRDAIPLREAIMPREPRGPFPSVD
jgi:quercetin dioxygenase-like cupin family protein